MSKSKERSMLNNFRQWLPNKLAQQIYKVWKVNLINQDFLYWIINPAYIPKELKDSWANRYLFDVLYNRNNLDWKHIIIEPKEKKYSKYIIMNDIIHKMMFLGTNIEWSPGRYDKWKNGRMVFEQIMDILRLDNNCKEEELERIIEELFDWQEKYLTKIWQIKDKTI